MRTFVCRLLQTLVLAVAFASPHVVAAQQEDKGFTAAKVSALVAKLKSAVREGRQDSIINAFGVPLAVNLGNREIVFRTAPEVKRYFKLIFAHDIREWAQDTNVDVWQHSGYYASGVGGLVWIGLSESGKVWVQTINLNYQNSTVTDSLDSVLNVSYQRTLKLFKSDSVRLLLLRESERTWLRFRDAQLAVEFPSCVGPGGILLNCDPCFDDLLARLTLSRSRELQLLEQGRQPCGTY